MNSFYIASGLANWEKVNEVKQILTGFGLRHTYDWTLNEKPANLERLRSIGLDEQKAVQEADIVIVLLPGGKGTHVELGMALAHNKPVFLYSSDQAAFDLDQASTFYYVDRITRVVGTVEELVRVVIGEEA